MTASPSTPQPTRPGLTAENLTLGYGPVRAVESVSLHLPPGRITAVVGPNGCGKSTLLRGLARLLDPVDGVVHLDGRDLSRQPARTVATQLGLLPQGPTAPDGITVRDLVSRGRHPHQRWFRAWSKADADAVTSALRSTGLGDVADTPVDQLSGGQRQRAWIALALTQDPTIMLLDEPTTFLDMAHQVEVMTLLTTLNRELGRTIVLVLHDVNLASRYAHHLVAMRDGAVIAQGAPAQVVTADLVRDVFAVACTVIPDPVSGTPLVLPHLDQPTGTA